MQITAARMPTRAQLQQLLESDIEGPISMLNLLRFREQAQYEDSRETDLTGYEAYQLYGEQMIAHVESKGGRIIFYGPAHQVIIGEVENLWDVVAIVEYPSKEAFVEIASSSEVEVFAVHRLAGLENQLLIVTTAGSIGPESHPGNSSGGEAI